MKWTILIAHAKGEEGLAEQLAGPLRDAGYGVTHEGTVLVGDSVVGETEKALSSGQPLVLCGTVRAVGSKWARKLVNAAHTRGSGPVFVVQVEEDADVESLAMGGKVALYYQDPAGAMQGLVESLNKYYPLDAVSEDAPRQYNAEQRYRELALESCDIIDLANLPENDRHVATRKLDVRRLYVPLRVRVEAASGTEAGEGELEAIEKRRAAAMRAGANAEAELVSVGERLGAARRLVVLGDPGAGKTTLTRWLATAYLLRLRQSPDWQDLPDVATLPEEDWLPIIIRCRELDRSAVGGALEDVLRHTLRKAEMTETESAALQAVLRDKLKRGQALLLLDGLDEITDPSARARFCQQLENIHIAYPDAPIVATSRVVGYREMGYRIGRGFEHVTVADLSKEDKDEFARRWCELVELPERRETAAAELIHDIHSSDRIERLTGNPMLLTTMALVKRKIGRLPSRRADLYANALQVLLNWRSDVDAPLDDREAVPQLEYVAYEMCRRGVQQLRRDEILELFERMRDEYPRVHAARNHTTEEFLRLLERRTGLLVEAGHTRHLSRLVPVYEFRHLTFQEYLAALALVDARFPGRREGSTLAENVAPLAGQLVEEEGGLFGGKELAVSESWRETLRLCVASCADDDVDQVLMAILKPMNGENARDTTRPRAVQAAACLADEPNASEGVAGAMLQTFVAQINDGDIWLLSATNLNTTCIELAESRWAGELWHQLVVEFIRREADSRGEVAELFSEVTNSWVQYSGVPIHHFVTEHVARLKSGGVTEAIEAALGIAAMAHRDLTTIAPNVPDLLLDTLDKGDAAAAAAAFALHRLNRPGVAESAWRGITTTPSGVEKIIKFINNPASDSETVSLLIEVLGRDHARQAFASLLAKLEDPSAKVRRAAVNSLGRIGDSEAVPALRKKLTDENQRIRHEAMRALSLIRGDRIDRSLMLGRHGIFVSTLDPAEEITEEHISDEAKRLEISVGEVRRRYEALAEEYGLKLGWRES
jgi:hypothetical protein